MPKRFLFCTTPGYGHFHPLVPVAQALQAAGHEVAFAARGFVKGRIEQAGFRFFEMGSDRDLDPEYQAWAPQRARLPECLESELIIYPKLFAGITPRLNLPKLVEAAKAFQPDVFVREGAEYAAVMAAEILGVPHATVAYTSALKGMPIFEQHAAARLDPIRAAWGLPPDPDLEALYRNLYLAFAPPSFALQSLGSDFRAAEIPATTHFIRPNFFDTSGTETLPDWMDDLPTQPTVYATMGTEVNNIPEFYPSVLQTLIAGLRDLPVNLIATLGRDRDPADFGVQMPNVHIERYIPQSLLLRRCDLMVMHGGSNSLLAALDVGLPLVVAPLIADQFFNAHVTEHVGLGKVVRLDQLTPANVRAAAEEVLAHPRYREKANQLKNEIHALPPIAYALELLVELASSKR